MTLQSIVFMINKGWTSQKAREWMKKHNYIPLKRAHRINNQIRYRIHEPIFNRYITQKQKPGISFVIGMK
jgi:hypothetical protein